MIALGRKIFQVDSNVVPFGARHVFSIKDIKAYSIPPQKERITLESSAAVACSTQEDEWPCLTKWSDDHLLSVAGDAQVSVNVRPGFVGYRVEGLGFIGFIGLMQRKGFRV